MARWKINLSEYEYDIVYKPDKANLNADVLSQNPCTSVTGYTILNNSNMVDTSVTLVDPAVDDAHHVLSDRTLGEGETTPRNKGTVMYFGSLIEHVFVGRRILKPWKIDRFYKNHTCLNDITLSVDCEEIENLTARMAQVENDELTPLVWPRKDDWVSDLGQTISQVRLAERARRPTLASSRERGGRFVAMNECVDGDRGCLGPETKTKSLWP